jgi:hypothetical protein
MRAITSFLAAIIIAGCSESTGPEASADGSVDVNVVTATTTSANIDPDGYWVSVDAGPEAHVSVNGTVNFSSLPSGVHVILLAGLAANCTVDGPNPQWFGVARGTPATVSFLVLCAVQRGEVGDWDY